MIDFHTRKPIADFLNEVTEPHQPLTREEQRDFFEAIIGIYEESASDARANFLITDVFDLLRVYVMEDKAIDRTDPNDTHRLTMSEVRYMIAGLIAGTAQVGVYLPKSEIERYKDIDFGICSFAQFVSDIYTPAKPIAQNKDAKEWQRGKPKEILEEAISRELVEKKADGYYWLKKDSKGHKQIALYGYFVYHVGERLGWHTTTSKGKVWLNWKKFNAIFRNYKELLPTATQSLDDYRHERDIPGTCYKVDGLLEKVFGDDKKRDEATR